MLVDSFRRNCRICLEQASCKELHWEKFATTGRLIQYMFTVSVAESCD